MAVRLCMLLLQTALICMVFCKIIHPYPKVSHFLGNSGHEHDQFVEILTQQCVFVCLFF